MFAVRPDYWSYEENESDGNYRRPYRERPAGGSEAQKELQSIRRADYMEEDYYYDDDDGDENFAPLDRTRPTRNSLSRRPKDDYDYYDDAPLEGDDADDDKSIGNFWSNPKSSLDAAPLAPRPRAASRRRRSPRRRRRA